jgi:hypothetical protein
MWLNGKGGIEADHREADDIDLVAFKHPHAFQGRTALRKMDSGHDELLRLGVLGFSWIFPENGNIGNVLRRRDWQIVNE